MSSASSYEEDDATVDSPYWGSEASFEQFVEVIMGGQGDANSVHTGQRSTVSTAVPSSGGQVDFCRFTVEQQRRIDRYQNLMDSGALPPVSYCECPDEVGSVDERDRPWTGGCGDDSHSEAQRARYSVVPDELFHGYGASQPAASESQVAEEPAEEQLPPIRQVVATPSLHRFFPPGRFTPHRWTWPPITTYMRQLAGDPSLPPMRPTPLSEVGHPIFEPHPGEEVMRQRLYERGPEGDSADDMTSAESEASTSASESGDSGPLLVPSGCDQ